MLPLLLTGARSATAADGPAPYVVAALSTTALYRPNGGPLAGPPGDVSPAIGVGAMLDPAVGVELDASLTLVDGSLGAGLGPGIVWSFTPYAYAAVRLFVPVVPVVDLVVLPSVGLTRVFDDGLAPFVELDALSAVGRGHPDFGLSPCVGVSYGF